MMTDIRISLLPDNLKRQSSILKKWTVLAMVLIVIAACSMIINFIYAVNLKYPVQELDQLKQESNVMNEGISKLSYIEEIFLETDKIEKRVKQLKGKNVDWCYTLDYVTDMIPVYGVRINKISIDTVVTEPGVSNCIISGNASDITNIANWTNYVKNKEGINSLNFNVLDQSTDANGITKVIFEVGIIVNKWNDGGEE